MADYVDEAQKFYDAAFLRHVHQLIAWGYEDSKQQIHANTEEEVITGFIYEAIKDRLNDPATPPEFDHYHVRNEPPVSHQPRTGKRRQRVDITFERAGELKPRPEFVFEAKRLHKGSHGISGYTGPEGMLCFIREEYAADCPVAGMLGYFQTDSSDYWLEQLSNKLVAADELKTTRTLTKCPVIPSLQFEWTSEHLRQIASAIRIHHIFLDCCH